MVTISDVMLCKGGMLGPAHCQSSIASTACDVQPWTQECTNLLAWHAVEPVGAFLSGVMLPMNVSPGLTASCSARCTGSSCHLICLTGAVLSGAETTGLGLRAIDRCTKLSIPVLPGWLCCNVELQEHGAWAACMEDFCFFLPKSGPGPRA